MEQEVKKNYTYRSLPENIRQIGEITGQRRIYMEDYVLTYIRKVFEDQRENAIVVFIGCEGKEEAAGSVFIYGAVELLLNTGMDAAEEIPWDELYQQAAQYFPGGRVMGWGCGVSIWNSQIDDTVRKIQKEQFAEAGRVLFLADLSEREEKMFIYDDTVFEELSGYFIYYERNPQMQNYMLREQQTEKSFESDYEDTVTQNIRTVIHTKTSRQEHMRYLVCGAACVMAFMVLLGAALVARSLAKINSLEKTIETLSDYVDDSKQGTSSEIVISHALESTQPEEEEKEKIASESAEATSAATPLPTGTASAAAQTAIPKQTAAPMATDASASADGTSASPAASATPLPIGVATSMPAAVPTATAKAAAEQSAVEKKKTSQAMAAGGVDRIKQSYIVRKGDTLSQIVWKQYHTFQYMDRVLQVNQIEDSDRIYEGQCILLPDP